MAIRPNRTEESWNQRYIFLLHRWTQRFCGSGAGSVPQNADTTLHIHIVRNSLRYVSTKDRKEVAKDLKEIYNSPTLDAAEQKLDVFAEKWSSKYPRIEKSWRSNWDNLITIFNYPMEIRRIIYTTNAIESLNSVIRKSIRNRKIFASDQSAAKVIYLAVKKASEHWTMPLRNWIPAMNRFAIEYEGRYDVENEVTQNY